MNRRRRPEAGNWRWPLWLSLGYLGAGALWILYSDRLLQRLADNQAQLSWYQTYKGWLFVAVTATLLYVICTRLLRAPAEAAAPGKDERRVRRLVILMLAVCIGAVLGNLALALYSARRDVLAKAGDDAQNLARALEQHTGRSIDGVDLALKLVARRVGRPPDSPQTGVDELMAEVLDNLPFVRAIWVIDADGDMIHDSQHLPGRYNLADREYFQVHRHDRSRGLFIDRPIPSKLNVWFIPVTRRIETADGRFVGVVVAGLEPKYLEAFYGSLEVGEEGMVALLRTDGVLMHRSPALTSRLGRPLGPEARLLDMLARSDAGTYETVSVLDGVERLYAYRRVPDRPLAVAVGLGKRESLAEWRSMVLTYGFGAFALLLLIGGLGYWLLRELAQRRLQQVRIDRLHRVQAVLSGINSLIVRVTNRQELFEDACRIAVEHGRFGMAWIDLVDEKTGVITPDTAAGQDAAYIVREAGPRQLGDPAHWDVVAQAISERRRIHSNDLLAEPDRGGERRRRAIARGYRSVVVLPLLNDDRVVATLALLAREADFFDADELALLDELAGDVSFALDHIAAQEHIDYLALYDVLTGLPNRTLFVDHLGQFLQQAKAQDSLCGLAKIDIERFRIINDTMGWASGDALLRLVAERLQAALGEHWLVSRIERDSFVFMVGCVQEAAEIAIAAKQLLHTCFDPPFRVGEQELRISARVGIAVYPDDGQDPATLLRNAETALARSKGTTDRFLFYAPEMNARVADSLAIESRLRTALERDEFKLHYQPKFDATSGAMVGLEGLLRWHDPAAGLVAPSEFIPVLEETGLLLEVGRWTLHQAMRDHRAWHEAGLAPPPIAVNVSASQLHEAAFTDIVEEAIATAGTHDHGLEIEITESTLMTRVEASAEKLAALRAMGIAIAIDDFGTGYSSLQYIARLPLDTLKIDRSFVVGMIDNPTDHTIVSSVVSLAHELDLKVVAEGVETQAQADALRALACDELQGFLFSPAVPAAHVERWLREGFGPA